MPHLSLAPTHTHTKPNMEATSTLLHGKSPFMIKIQFARRRRDMQNPKYHCRRMTVQAVLARPASGDRNMDILNSPLSTTRTSYNDNWFDHLAINYLSHVVQETVGLRNDERGYGSLVEAATSVSRSFNPTQQRELVIQALDKAFPKPILSLIRVMMPPSKFAREYFAVFTTKFFPWLVGSCEVRESEFNGRREKNVVHIKKCRFLEESNCVGMCTNLCKMPSQAFIKDSLGMPVNMVPNFDDMSCEMIFGQNPPAENDDPAFKQPCYKLCTAKRKHTTNCIS